MNSPPSPSSWQSVRAKSSGLFSGQLISHSNWSTSEVFPTCMFNCGKSSVIDYSARHFYTVLYTYIYTLAPDFMTDLIWRFWAKTVIIKSVMKQSRHNSGRQVTKELYIVADIRPRRSLIPSGGLEVKLNLTLTAEGTIMNIALHDETRIHGITLGSRRLSSKTIKKTIIFKVV